MQINVFQVTRKIIRRFVSPDGTEKEEVSMQGTPQDPVHIEDGDSYSKVIKRVVLKSDTQQSEVSALGCSQGVTSLPPTRPAFVLLLRILLGSFTHHQQHH